MNVIHNFPGMYDVDMNVELYLPTEKEITKAKYDMIKKYLGVLGPGTQVLIKENGKYYLKADEDATVAENKIKALLNEMGQTYPA